MQADYLILADAVAVAQGKHYIHGGGWNSLFVPSLPASHPVVGIATRLRIPQSEANQRHTVEIDVLEGEDGESILPDAPLQSTFDVGQPLNAVPHSDQVLALAFNVANLQFRASGIYTIVLRVNEHDLATTQFSVIHLPEAPA